MDKKKIALTACAAALVGTFAVGGTLAYFTAQTNTVENVFAGNNKDLKGIIDERFDKETAESYTPGDVIYKEPWLENKTDSIDAWVAVKVDVDAEGNAISYDDFVTKYATIQTKTANGQFVDGFNTADFKEVTVPGANYKFFVYNTVVKAGDKTKNIFDQVTVNAQIKKVFNSETAEKTVWKEVTKADYDSSSVTKKEISGKYYVQESVTSSTFNSEANYFVDKDGTLEAANISRLPKFNVNVTGYMVQADHVSYEEAVKELTALVQK